MVAINTTINPDLKPLNQDDGANGVGDAQAAGAPVAPSALQAPLTYANATGLSSFDGTVNNVGPNVLGTAPPALTADSASTSLASAIARMQVWNSKMPFMAGLTRASEDGTAPAIPKTNALSVGSSGAATTNMTAAPANAPAANAPATNAPSAANVSQPAGATGSGPSYNPDSFANNTDTSKFSDQANQEASALRTTTTNIQDKPCNKKDYVGEDACIEKLTGLGMDYNRAAAIARFLDDQNNNTGTMHNDQDEQTTALAIGALSAMDKAGNKAGADKMLSSLNDLADAIPNSTSSNAAGQKYYQTINTVGQFALAASANAATASLTTPSPTQAHRIVPYPTMSD